MSILLNEQLDLRSGWRFATYAAVFVIILFATAILLSMFVPSIFDGDLGLLALNAVALAVPSVLALKVMSHFVDRVPVLTFGAGFHKNWRRDLKWGVVLAVLMLGGLFGGMAVTGELNMAAGTVSPLGLAGIVLVLCVAAANEELIFRGYPLQVLMAGIGPWPAMIVMSAIFGLGHHLNPNATWLGTGNTALAGILLCLAYVRTRSLWFPYGIHIAWNLGLGPISGFSLSGMNLESILHTEANGADWITGGAYGPEAGVLVTGIMGAAIVAVVLTKRVDVSPDLSSLLTRHPGKVYEDSASTSSGE